MSKLVPFGWLAILAALGAFAFHIYIHRLETASKDWPTASAQILSSRIVKATRASLRTSLTSTVPYRDPRYDNEEVWALNVEYSYKVNEESFSGNKATSIDHASIVRPGTAGPNADMVALANELPEGKMTQAHYNPSDPSESYLIYMESGGNKTVLTTAWVLVGLGILMIAAPSFSK